MDCCDTRLYDDQFDAKVADQELREYRRHGPNGWTTELIAGLAAGGIEGMTVLDIGAGVGAVHHALLEAGAASAIDVDASGPYLAAAQQEAERRGLADRVTYRRGDAAVLAAELPEADLVALDRVVCCYPHASALVGAAAGRTRWRLGMVLPRDDGWVRAAVALANAWDALRRDPFRFYVHPTDAVARIASTADLVQRSRHRGLFWQVLVFERPGS